MLSTCGLLGWGEMAQHSIMVPVGARMYLLALVALESIIGNTRPNMEALLYAEVRGVKRQLHDRSQRSHHNFVRARAADDDQDDEPDAKRCKLSRRSFIVSDEEALGKRVLSHKASLKRADGTMLRGRCNIFAPSSAWLSFFCAMSVVLRPTPILTCSLSDF